MCFMQAHRHGGFLQCLQAFGADVMLAEAFSPCPALLASRLDLPWVNYWPAAPLEPFMSSLWSGANRQMFQPNPLSYYPQLFMRSTTQRMVCTNHMQSSS